MHLYLTGFMGSGKTTIGRAVAKRLTKAFVDLDDAVEARAGMTISEIFERHGEAEFRRLESVLLSEVSALGSRVVATGGGTMDSPKNLRLMKQSGITIWLDAPLDLLLERLEADPADKRPLFNDPESFTSLYRQRLPLYRRSDFRIEIGPETEIGTAAETLIETLKTRRCDT